METQTKLRQQLIEDTHNLQGLVIDYLHNEKLIVKEDVLLSIRGLARNIERTINKLDDAFIFSGMEVKELFVGNSQELIHEILKETSALRSKEGNILLINTKKVFAESDYFSELPKYSDGSYSIMSNRIYLRLSKD